MKFGKIFKRTLSMLTATAIFCSLSIPAFAQSPNSDENGEYVVTYRAEPVTDIDALVALAEQQPKTVSEEEDDGLIRVKQLTEVREYTDGSIEKDYAESAISLAADQNLSSTHYDNHVKGYTVVATLNYTYRYDGGMKYRVNSVVTRIEKTSMTEMRIEDIELYYCCSTQDFSYKNFSYNNSSPIGTQTFTLPSKHSGFYFSSSDASATEQGVAAQCAIDIGKKVEENGKEIIKIVDQIVLHMFVSK